MYKVKHRIRELMGQPQLGAGSNWASTETLTPLPSNLFRLGGDRKVRRTAAWIILLGEV